MKWFCFKTSTGTIRGKFYPLQLFRIKTFAHQRQRVLGGRAAHAGGGTSEVDSGASRAKSWGSQPPTHRPDGPRRHPRAKASRPRCFASPQTLLRHHGASCVITSPNVRTPRSVVEHHGASTVTTSLLSRPWRHRGASPWSRRLSCHDATCFFLGRLTSPRRHPHHHGNARVIKAATLASPPQ